MGWIPTQDEILNEAKNYTELPFYKKSKNILAIFVIAISALSLFLMKWVEQNGVSLSVYEIALNVLLSLFIWLNHRWAMIVFCFLYLISKIVFIFSSLGSPVTHLIFGAVAVMLTYSAFKVATELREILHQELNT